jgi:hypothetical protein
VYPKSEEDTSLLNYNRYTQFEFTRPLEAPIAAGEVIGILTYIPVGSDKPIEYELIASRSVNRRLAIAPTLDEIRQYAETDPNPFPPFSVELLFILSLPVLAVAIISHLLYKLFTRKRKLKYKQKRRYTTRYYR